jgi:GTP cyclohydrolase I
MLERVVKDTKWTTDKRQGRENHITAACENLLKLADEALDRAREQETAGTNLKILENAWDKLKTIAKNVFSETDEKLKGELTELNEEYSTCNKKCVQSMSKMLFSFDDLDMSGQAQAALEEDSEATRSCCKIRGLKKKLIFVPTGSEAGISVDADRSGQAGSAKSTSSSYLGKGTSQDGAVLGAVRSEGTTHKQSGTWKAAATKRAGCRAL